MFKDLASLDTRRMHHEEILRELYALERFGMKLGLANITELLHRIGDPHLRFPAAHVTGSNGKYQGKLPASVALDLALMYTLEINATAGTHIARRSIPVTVVDRVT